MKWRCKEQCLSSTRRCYATVGGAGAVAVRTVLPRGARRPFLLQPGSRSLTFAPLYPGPCNAAALLRLRPRAAAAQQHWHSHAAPKWRDTHPTSQPDTLRDVGHLPCAGVSASASASARCAAEKTSGLTSLLWLPSAGLRHRRPAQAPCRSEGVPAPQQPPLPSRLEAATLGPRACRASQAVGPRTRASGLVPRAAPSRSMCAHAGALRESSRALRVHAVEKQARRGRWQHPKARGGSAQRGP